MENYEERYKEALERASKLRVQNPFDTVGQMVEHIFPELKENEDEKIRKELIAIYSVGAKVNAKTGDIPDRDIVAWLEKQKDYIKFPNSAYTSNKDIIEFANKYSHTVWGKLMDNFKIIENYSIGCNDVSDIVLNAIINTYNWIEKQDQVKESHISQHESKTCEENNEFLTNEDERIKETFKGFVKGYSAFINGQWRLGDFTVNRLIDWLEKQVKKKSDDEVMKIRRKAYSDGYIHGQYNIAIALGKESVDALEHFVRGIGESGYASPYDNRTKLVYKLLEQLKQIVK